MCRTVGQAHGRSSRALHLGEQAVGGYRCCNFMAFAGAAGMPELPHRVQKRIHIYYISIYIYIQNIHLQVSICVMPILIHHHDVTDMAFGTTTNSCNMEIWGLWESLP